MSTQYFLLIKKDDNVQSKNNQIVIPSSQTHILPSVNVEYYRKNGLFEGSLIEWCKQFGNKNKVFLDIGAHSGTYGISLSEKFKTVHCFEPQRMTYYSLCGSTALSAMENIHCHNFGLGSEKQKGIKELKIVSKDGGGSSLHATTGVIAKENIEIKVLDDLNIKNVGFIKIDVEGNEYDVLIGAKNTLEKSGYPKILFESNDHDKKLFNLIKKYGYTYIKINGYGNMFLAEKIVSK